MRRGNGDGNERTSLQRNATTDRPKAYMYMHCLEILTGNSFKLSCRPNAVFLSATSTLHSS